ncbi:TetR/AcrR family transcriptional regulator [Roseococcus pinisoli]|uniref:TetR/AcrR family transcriptional regulator n=1 Tax=Roseococcus pinisoli TaxID=2835040 RepID=A0ABS5QCS0_9PROT|nr:TetR/AcrR family transcriptional regulator [Roseococcus pinisoli]MBS7811288.1 TetR/AcrR family transcriptional regulator [Roseococcus pinisoli]
MVRTGRPRSFDREEAIDAAMKLFWEQGYEPTSLSQLREGMGGLSSASFYGAFESKEALFREVVARYIATYGQSTASLKDDSLPPREAIELALRRSARMQTEASHPPGCLVILGSSNCSPESRHIDALLAEERARNRHGIQRHVERAVAQGELPPGTDTVGLAAMFNIFLLGIAFDVKDGVPFRDIDAAITALMRRWDNPAV